MWTVLVLAAMIAASFLSMMATMKDAGVETVSTPLVLKVFAINAILWAPILALYFLAASEP